MKTSLPIQFAIALICCGITAGCAMSRGNVASRSTQGWHNTLTSGHPPSQLADNEAETAEIDEDAPPVQPGTRSSQKKQKKLTGWLSSRDPKPQSIPLDRTDDKRESEDGDAEANDSFWKHNQQPDVSGSPQLAESRSETMDSSDPFEKQ